MTDIMMTVERLHPQHPPEPLPVRYRLPVHDMNVNADVTSPPPVCLRRERPPGPVLPSFDPPQHPHCAYPDNDVHPSLIVQRTLTLANDNSSLVRQSRCHTIRPDRDPGTQYAGTCYQKMGHVLLGTYKHPSNTITYDGRL